MVVGVSRLELFFPENQSLKDKRQVMKKIVEKTRAKFSISIAEVDRSELWQRGNIGFSIVGVKQDHVGNAMENVCTYIESLYIGEIINTQTDIMVI